MRREDHHHYHHHHYLARQVPKSPPPPLLLSSPDLHSLHAALSCLHTNDSLLSVVLHVPEASQRVEERRYVTSTSVTGAAMKVVPREEARPSPPPSPLLLACRCPYSYIHSHPSLSRSHAAFPPVRLAQLEMLAQL